MKTSLKNFAQYLALMSAFLFNHALAEPSISWGITITGGTPPPIMRDEPIPPPRAGYVWIPGYWNWQSGAHVWVSGRWERQRTGYVYVEPVWREGPKGWELHRGGWHSGGKGKHRHGSDHCPPGQQKKEEGTICWRAPRAIAARKVKGTDGGVWRRETGLLMSVSEETGSVTARGDGESSARRVAQL